MISSTYHIRRPALLLMTLASVLASVASPRSAEASSLWEWLFPSRNHSYYAGPHGPAPNQVGPHQYPPPQPSMHPVSAHYGYSQAAPAAGQPIGAPATGTPQQLTNPLVIIPASSAPIAGQPTAPAPNTPAANTLAANTLAANTLAASTPASSYPASNSMAGGSMAGGSSGNGAAGYAPSGYVSSGYAPSQTTTSGNPPSGVVSTGYSSTGTVMNGQFATTAMMPGQTQQVFMTNQATRFGNCATCLPGHARSTSYRTVWYRVPTTNVRPVAAVDPCTGLQSTVMRPCTTYSWQARRVPTMRSPSLCERLFSCFRRPPPPTLPMTANYVCGPNCGPVSAAGTAAPYYSPPATTSPSSVSPATGVSPWGGTSLPAEGYPSGSYPSGSYPGGTFQGGGTTPGGSPPLREPADERPSLGPRRYAPSNGDAYDPNRNSPGSQGTDDNRTHGDQGNGNQGNGNVGNDRYNDNGYENRNLDQGTDPDLDYDSAARHAPFSGRTPTLRGPQYSGPSEASPVRSSQEASESRGRAPQPVPDPDALLNAPQRFEPPRLLNPKDRRASQAVQRAGDYVLASWPESPRAHSQGSERAGLAGNRVSEKHRPAEFRNADVQNGDFPPRHLQRPAAGPVSLDVRIPDRGPITPPQGRTRPTTELRRGPAPLDDGGWRTVPR